MDAFDAETFANDLFGGELDGTAGEDGAGEDEDATGAEVAEALLHGIGVAGKVEDDLSGVGLWVEGGSELGGEGLTLGVGVKGEDFFCAERSGHGAGVETEHAGTEDDDGLVFDGRSFAESGGYGGGGAVGDAGDGVWDVGRDFEDFGASGEEAVLGEATGEVGGGGDGGVAEFVEAITFGVEAAEAVVAGAAGPDHGPSDAVSDFVGGVGGYNVADHFVAEDGGCGGVAATGVGVKIAATDGGAADADESLTSVQAGKRKGLDAERLARVDKDGSFGFASWHPLQARGKMQMRANLFMNETGLKQRYSEYRETGRIRGEANIELA